MRAVFFKQDILKQRFLKNGVVLYSGEVENAVSDRDSYLGHATGIASTKNSVGQILNGKIRAGNVGRFHPAQCFRIVGFVENGFHSRLFYNKCRERKSSIGSVNEQEPNEIAKI